MLFGQLPGQNPSGATPMTTALPSYTAAMNQFLNRFGPYRLQPYSLPGLPALTLHQPVPPQAPRMAVPQRATIPRYWLREPGERGGNGRSRGSQGRPGGGAAANRSGNTTGGGRASGFAST